jgi:hypothetical protein
MGDKAQEGKNKAEKQHRLRWKRKNSSTIQAARQENSLIRFSEIIEMREYCQRQPVIGWFVTSGGGRI